MFRQVLPSSNGNMLKVFRSLHWYVGKRIFRQFVIYFFSIVSEVSNDIQYSLQIFQFFSALSVYWIFPHDLQPTSIAKFIPDNLRKWKMFIWFHFFTRVKHIGLAYWSRFLRIIRHLRFLGCAGLKREIFGQAVESPFRNIVINSQGSIFRIYPSQNYRSEENINHLTSQEATETIKCI